MQFVLLYKTNVRLHTHLQIFNETERTIYKHFSTTVLCRNTSVSLAHFQK